MPRSSALPAAAVVLSALAGLATARIEVPRYAITTLSLAGPASIPEGGSREFTLRVVTERIGGDAPAPAATVARSLAERVQPVLNAGASILAAADIDLGRLRQMQTVRFTLHCRNNEVVGPTGTSGLGARAGSAGRMGLPWWDKPATLRVQLDGLVSNPLTVLCDAG